MRQVVVILIMIFSFGINAAQAQKIKAIATFSIIEDVLKNVASHNIEIKTLVGIEGDAHDYEPTPADIITIAQANVIFENGLHFEHWMDKLYTSSQSKAKRFVLSEGVTPLTLEDNPQEKDPHTWQDVSSVILYTQHIKEALVNIDPVNKEIYEANAKKYIEELNQLDAWIKEQVAVIKNRKLVTNHDALGYFARAYGFEIIGAAIPSATTDAADPSAKQIAELLDMIKKNKIHVIFSENMANDKLVQSLSKETHVVVAPELYTDALGQKGSQGDTYINMIRHNVKIFVEYLK